MEIKNIRFENICKKYAQTQVYENFSLEIERGRITCLLGESGSGKTTLLNMLASLIPFEGKISNVPSRISYIFQEERLLPNLTVYGNIRYVLGKGADRAKIMDILQKVELADKADA